MDSEVDNTECHEYITRYHSFLVFSLFIKFWVWGIFKPRKKAGKLIEELDKGKRKDT